MTFFTARIKATGPVLERVFDAPDLEKAQLLAFEFSQRLQSGSRVVSVVPFLEDTWSNRMRRETEVKK